MNANTPRAEELSVSRETLARLKTYAELIQKWSPRINLVSKASLSDIWNRHIEDSLQIARQIQVDPGRWADLGSGGGLPGIVISILHPETSVILVESDQRKAAFLQSAIHTLSLNAEVARSRIETLAPLSADVVSARALAPLPLLLDYVSRHLAPGGVALLPKGRQAEQELAEARKTWCFTCDSIPSTTDPGAHILRMERITRA